MIDDNLLDLANSDLYLHNPFRTLRLNADASLREIKKKQRLLTLSQEIGIESDDPTHTSEVILNFPYDDNNEPVKRLLHRIFWIWPDKEKKQTDFIPVDYFATAISFWERQIKSGRSVVVPLHNLAVTYQLVFLESVQAGRQFSELAEASGELKNACEKSLQYWMRLLKTKNFWQRIYDWVAEENDPRLDANFLKRLRKQLSSFVCVIYLNAAKKLRDSGKSDQSADIVNQIWNIELPENVRENALNYQFQKTRELVQSQVNAYQESVIAMHPPAAEKILRENLTEIKGSLDFAELLTVGKFQNSMTALVDTVTASFLNTIKKHDALGKGLFLSMHTLADMRDLPASASLHQRVVDEQQKAREIFNKGNYWYTEIYFNTRELILNSLERSHQHFKAQNYNSANSLLEALLNNTADLTEDEEKTINQSLSTSLNSQAMGYFEKMIGILGKPRRLHMMIKTRKKESSFWGTYCSACGQRIVGKYFNYSFEGEKYIVCDYCARLDQSVTSNTRSKSRESILMGIKLTRKAIEINQRNSQAKDNLRQLEKIANDMGFSIPRSSTSRPRSPVREPYSEDKKPYLIWVWIGIILIVICYFFG